MDPFGRENMSCDRKSMALRPIIEADPCACVEEAVRFIYYTSPGNRRNVRIMPNYQVAEVWDGEDWWTKSISETIDAMIDRAVEEIEFHIDYCDLILQDVKDRAEMTLYSYKSDAEWRDRTRTRVIEAMRFPYGE